MDANYYIDLAKQGKRMPIATHLVLHEKPDPEAILVDGARLGEVMLETARRFGNPMALPVMDLTLEKDVLLRKIGIAAEEIEAFHFDADTWYLLARNSFEASFATDAEKARWIARLDAHFAAAGVPH